MTRNELIKELAKEIFVNAMKGAEGLASLNTGVRTRMLKLTAEISLEAATEFHEVTDEMLQD